MNNTISNKSKELIQLAYDLNYAPEQKVTQELLNQLDLINEFSAIPKLFPLVFSYNIKLARRIATILHNILNKTPLYQLGRLDTLNEQDRPQYTYRKIKLSDIDALKLSPDIKHSLYALMTFHYNGYIREQALSQFANKVTKLTIPILLTRANDWVKNIHTSATDSLLGILKTDKIKHFLVSLPLVSQLSLKNRYDHSPLISTIISNLTDKLFGNLLDLINNKNYLYSRAAFQILVAKGDHLLSVVNSAKDSSDIIVKLNALKIVKSILPRNELILFLKKWLNDKSFIIRRHVISMLIDCDPENIADILTTCLYDKSFSMRQIARFYLSKKSSKISQINFATVYLESIKINKHMPASILGFAETVSSENFYLIIPFLKHESVNVRRAVIRAVFRLKPPSYMELILVQLPASENGILKEISLGVINNPKDIDINLMEPLFCYYKNTYSNKLFFKTKLAITRNSWAKLNYMLESIINSDDNELSLIIENKILAWVNDHSHSSFAQVDTTTIDQLILKSKCLVQARDNIALYTRLIDYLTWVRSL